MDAPGNGLLVAYFFVARQICLTLQIRHQELRDQENKTQTSLIEATLEIFWKYFGNKTSILYVQVFQSASSDTGIFLLKMFVFLVYSISDALFVPNVFSQAPTA